MYFQVLLLLDRVFLHLSPSSEETSLFKGVISNAMVNGFYFFMQLPCGFELYRMNKSYSARSSFRM